MTKNPEQIRHPNILLITCDQYRFPRFSYGPDAGFAKPFKEIGVNRTKVHTQN